MDKKKTDIVLIQPPGWASENPPLGLAMLKSYLGGKEISVKIADLNIILYNLRHGDYFNAWDLANGYYTWERESSVKRMFAYYSNEIEDFIYSVLALSPGTIGFSAHCSSFISARLLASKFRQFSPETKIIFGGPQVAAYGARWEELLASNLSDAVVFGEGEESLTEYLKTVETLNDSPLKGIAYKGASGQIINGGPRALIKSLDSLPFADFSDFNLPLYAGKRVLPTYFSRGCINKCVYCTENKFFPHFRNRTGRRVFDEILHQLSLYPGTSFFRMHDSVSNANIPELNKFCDLLEGSGLNIRYNLENAIIRKEMDSAFYGKLKKTGCDVIGYGLETPSKPLLKAVGKGACMDADIDKVVEEGARAGLPIGVNMMFGLPGETDSDYQAQLEFLKRHSPNRGHITINPALNFCYFPEGSAAHCDPAKYGIDMSLGELYWSSLDGKNTFPARLEKFERFCALAAGLGYRNLFDITQSMNKHEMLGNYYYRLRDYEKSLFHLKLSFEGEIQTLEIAGTIVELYEKLSTPKDELYSKASTCVREAEGEKRTWLDNILTRRDLLEAVIRRTETEDAVRVEEFVAIRPPEIRFTIRGAKNIIKYGLSLVRKPPEKIAIVHHLSATRKSNKELARQESARAAT